MHTLFAATEVGSVVVAVALIFLVGAIMVTAIFRYQSIEEVMRLWSGLGTLVGLIAGTMGTYFFTHQATQRAIDARDQAVASKNIAEETVGVLQAELAQTRTNVNEALANLSSDVESMATPSYKVRLPWMGDAKSGWDLAHVVLEPQLKPELAPESGSEGEPEQLPEQEKSPGGQPSTIPDE